MALLVSEAKGAEEMERQRGMKTRSTAV